MIGQKRHSPEGEYLPTGHFEHTESPPFDSVPGGQRVHNSEPADEKYPAGQRLHNAREAAPDCLKNVPALHSSHVRRPKTSEYVPYGQAPHSIDPDLVEFVPGRQLLHIEASLAPATLLNEPAGHKEHVRADVMATLELYVPAGQSKQREEPGELPKVPLGQATQSTLVPDTFCEYPEGHII